MKNKVIGISKNITQSFREFIHSNQFSGILLIFSATISLFLSNTILGHKYVEFWHIDVGVSFGNLSFEKPIEFWINDIGMSFFFLLVGLEIKRELFIGELNSVSKATLPIAAAIGGIVRPPSTLAVDIATQLAGVLQQQQPALKADDTALALAGTLPKKATPQEKAQLQHCNPSNK